MRSTNLALPKQAYFRTSPVAEPSQPVPARTAARGFAVEVYDRLEAVEHTWRAFQERADCTVFQTYEWLSTWQRHIGVRNGDMPCIVVARDSDGAVLCILPLAVRRRRLARELVWLGTELCDYNAPLLAADFSKRVDATGFKNLWRQVMQLVQAHARFDMVRLEKMPDTIGTQPNPMLGLPTRLHPSASYATPLTADWESFYTAKRSGSTRRRDRTKRNGLAAFGEIKLVTPDSASGTLGALTVLVEQKSAMFARRGIPNLFARPGYMEFYQDFAGNPQSRHIAHVSELQVGAQIAAANLGLMFRGRYYYVLSSYTDGEMARLGPGAAHLHELFRYAIDQHCTVFDFTIGDERYKRDWCDGAQPLYDHDAVTTWRGATVAMPMVALQRLKRKIKQTPVLWIWFSKSRAQLAALRSKFTRRGSD